MSSEEFMRKEFTLNLDSLTDLEEFAYSKRFSYSFNKS